MSFFSVHFESVESRKVIKQIYRKVLKMTRLSSPYLAVIYWLSVTCPRSKGDPVPCDDYPPLCLEVFRPYDSLLDPDTEVFQHAFSDLDSTRTGR